MKNFVAYVYYESKIYRSKVVVGFESNQQIGVRFNCDARIDEVRRKIEAKISRRCGRMISRFFYIYPISSNPRILIPWNLLTMKM